MVQRRHSEKPPAFAKTLARVFEIKHLQHHRQGFHDKYAAHDRHHHFEKSGWKETQVVVRFWIITMLLCLIGLSTLKLR